jgi:glutathione S-transferase
MPLKLYFHPLSSFCQKVLIALYENDTAFEPHIVDLLDPAEAAAFKAMWPIRRFPVLRDEAHDRMIPESSIIIEYLDHHRPGRTRFLPAEPERARDTRMRDRFFDLYVNAPVQTIVFDKLRPPGQNDPFGVEQAKAQLRTAYHLIEQDFDGQAGGKTWATGDAFTMADCAAAPALFYADKVLPFAATHKNTAAYFDRLTQRPSYARVLNEAQPYFVMFPG